MSKLLPQDYYARPTRMDDLEAVVEVFNADTRRLIGVDMFAAPDLKLEWEVPGFDLGADSVVVLDAAGKVVAYQDAWDPEEPHVLADCWGRVHPDHTGCGIGSFLLGWAEQRSYQQIVKAPPEVRYGMRCSILTLNEAAQALYARAGLDLVRHSLRMVIELNGSLARPQWPDGVAIRTIHPGQEERAVYQAVREAFQDHWGYVERPFEEDFQLWKRFNLDREDFDPGLWFLAMDGEKIAGFSLCRPRANDDPGMGWVAMLGVPRPWRRRGLGLALLEHSFAEFSRRGQSRVGLGVDAQSLTGATRLYLKAGMSPDHQHQFSIYEKELRPGLDLRRQSADEG